jgi:phosphomannomutase/phosphoglucomutase
LRSTGLRLVDVGCVPTPLLYFAACTHCAGSGVMVTGSHNPPQYNGIKIMLAGETLYGDAIQALLQRIRVGRFVCGEGESESLPVIDEYIARLSRGVSLARPLRVVVDGGNGVAGLVMPHLLRGLGCDVVELFCEVDGRFPHHHPDPNQPENLQVLQRTVIAEKADIGLAFDGDADRLGVVSCRGEIIWPDRLLMLFARDLLLRYPGTEVVYDIKCSRNLGLVIEQAGGLPVMWRTGHSLLKARMQQGGALLAGEMSGHLFLKEGWFGFDDALYAAVRLLGLLAADVRGAAALFDELPDMLNTPELHVQLPAGEPHEFVAQLLQHRDAFGSAKLTTIDGIRADYEDGWGLVRASNTTPILVLRFEAESEAALKRIEAIFSSLLRRLQPGLKLPF